MKDVLRLAKTVLPAERVKLKKGGSPEDDIVRQRLAAIPSIEHEDPAMREKAFGIAQKTHAITSDYDANLGQSFYGFKTPTSPENVQATVNPIPGVNPLTPKKQTYEQFYNTAKGGTLVNLGGDRSRLGRLTHMHGRELAWPVDLHAGPQYMLEPNKGAVWANAAGQTTRNKRLIESLQKKGPVYGVYSPMGPKSVDSSFQMSDALMSQIANQKPEPEIVKKFDKELRAGLFEDPDKRDKAIEKMKEWPGLDDPWAARNFLKTLPGTTRSLIVKHMDKSGYHKAGFPHVGMTRVALTDPDLLKTGGNMIGHRVVELTPESIEASAFEHNTYPEITSGRYVADVPLVQRHYALPQAVQQFAEEPHKPGILHPYSENPNARSGFKKMTEEQKMLQNIDEPWLESVLQGLANQKKYGFKKGGRTAYKKGGKVEGAIWHARDAFDDGGDVRGGDSVGGLRGDTGGFSERDVGEAQGAVNAATASAQDAQQGMRDMNNTFGKGFSDVASAIGNAIISPAEAKENPPQLAKSFINPHETVNAALASGRADVAPSGLMHGVGTEKDVSEANAAEAAAARMDQAFGQPVGTTTFNTPPLGGGAFEPPRSATGTPAESLLAAVQPSTPEPMQPAPNANLAVATPGVSQPVTPPNAYAQGQMPQPTGESPSNPFADIANKYTTAANTGIAGMQGYNAGTYANQMPQPTGPINPYAQGQMPQPSGPSDASVRAARDAITQNMGGNAPSTQPTAPSTQPMPTAGNVPTPPIPLRDLQGPSIAEGIAGAFGLSTQQQFDKFYKGYIDQGHNELDAYNKAISDIQTMRSNAKPGPFDKGGKRQMIQQIMPDGTIQMVPAPYKRGGGVHNSQMVDHVLTKFGASLPASSNPYFGNMAGRRR